MTDKGRPTKYTEEIAASICERLSNGETLRSICLDDDLPSEAAVRGWAIEDRQGFSARYAKARESGYLYMADELLDIADFGSNDWMERHDGENVAWVANGEVLQRSRLRVDTRKWMLSKVLPKIYGDKITTEHTGRDGGPIETKDVGNRDLAKAVAQVLKHGLEAKG